MRIARRVRQSRGLVHVIHDAGIIRHAVGLVRQTAVSQVEIVPQFMHQSASLHLYTSYLIVGGDTGWPQTERYHETSAGLLCDAGITQRGVRRLQCEGINRLTLGVERPSQRMCKQRVMENVFSIL